MEIRVATTEDISLIHDLAYIIWPATYGPILSAEQIAFMLKDIYSVKGIKKQIDNGKHFLIAENNGDAVGYAAYSLSGDIFKINQLYILPSEQGKGTGRLFVGHLTELARGKGLDTLELNVNRSNPAFNFYKKIGFEVYEEVDIPYHRFVLDDYVMRKTALQNSKL